MATDRLLAVCMSCNPGLRHVHGARLSHGYCLYHGLVELERHDLITPRERLQLRGLHLLRRVSGFAVWFLIFACADLILNIVALALRELLLRGHP